MASLFYGKSPLLRVSSKATLWQIFIMASNLSESSSVCSWLVNTQPVCRVQLTLEMKLSKDSKISKIYLTAAIAKLLLANRFLPLKGLLHDSPTWSSALGYIKENRRKIRNFLLWSRGECIAFVEYFDENWKSTDTVCGRNTSIVVLFGWNRSLAAFCSSLCPIDWPTAIPVVTQW